jgi:hypothetical protein
MNARILNRNSQIPADGWYHIEVTGTHPAGKNRKQVIDQAALESIVNRFAAERAEAGDDWPGMLVDLDHLSRDINHTTEAYGWLHEVEIRNHELHGRIELTDLGEHAIKNKRVKFFSTEYAAEDLETLSASEVRPLRLDGLAFTNRPNNRGGKPISNRTGADPAPTDETNTTPMKSIAEKLGLPADADEAAILNKLTEVMSENEKLKTKTAETEADAVINRFGNRIPEAARAGWRKQLIANRAGAEELMESTFPKRGEAQTPIHNRAGATSPDPVGDGASEDKKGDEQAALVSQIRNRDRCTHSAAWAQARRERPDLFR